jgi:hypothetical protein
MDTDMMPPGVLAPEDEEDRRQPVMPPYLGAGRARPDIFAGASAQPVMPPFVGPRQPVEELAPAAPRAQGPTMPPMPIGPPKPQPLASQQAAQTMPPYQPGPQMQRYQELAATGQPQLGGWRKVLDTIGSLFPIGRAIETEIPGTPQNYNAKLNQAAVRAAKEQQFSAEAQRQTGDQQKQQQVSEQTPEWRRNYIAQHPDEFSDLTDFEKSDFILSGKFPQREPTQPQPRTENLQQGYADAIRDAIQNNRDPNTDPHVQAWKAAIAGEAKPPKHSAGEVKLDEGIPTGIYGEGDKLYRANDPNMPPELKAALTDAVGAHSQKVKEGLDQATAGRAVLAGSRAVNMITPDGQMVAVNGEDLPRFMRENPGAVEAGAGASVPAMGQQALINDIRTSAENVSKNLNVLDRKGFDYAKLAAALADPNTTSEAYLQAIPRGSLDDKGQQFVADLFNLREQAMAMRAVLKAGQGSEDMRRAILQTLPGIASGSSGFGKKQLDNLLGVLARVEKGVPKVPQRGGGTNNLPPGWK